MIKTKRRDRILFLAAILLLSTLGCGSRQPSHTDKPSKDRSSVEHDNKTQRKLSDITTPEMILDLHAKGVNLADPEINAFLVSISYPLRSGKAGYFFNNSYHSELNLPERASHVLSEIIELGIDINMRDKNGRTLLLNALLANYDVLADKLIAKGANIFATDNDMHTALMHAAENKNTKVALFLIGKGLNAKAKDKDGCSVLLYAVRGGSSEIVEALLKKGADVNDQDNSGMTPLMQISYFRKDDDKEPHKIATRLLDMGAKIDVQDRQGWTPLIYAVYHGETEIALELIAKGADIHHKDSSGRNAMEFAVANNRKQIIAALKKRETLSQEKD